MTTITVADVLKERTDDIDTAATAVSALVQAFFRLVEKVKTYYINALTLYRNELEQRISLHSKLAENPVMMVKKISKLTNFVTRSTRDLDRYVALVARKRSEFTVQKSALISILNDVRQKNTSQTNVETNSPPAELLKIVRQRAAIEKGIVRLNREVTKFNILIDEMNAFNSNLAYAIIKFPKTQLKIISLSVDLRMVAELTATDNSNDFTAIMNFIANDINALTPVVQPIGISQLTNSTFTSVSNTDGTADKDEPREIFERLSKLFRMQNQQRLFDASKVYYRNDYEEGLDFYDLETIRQFGKISEDLRVRLNYLNNLNPAYNSLRATDLETHQLSLRFIVRYLCMLGVHYGINILPPAGPVGYLFVSNRGWPLLINLNDMITNNLTIYVSKYTPGIEISRHLFNTIIKNTHETAHLSLMLQGINVEQRLIWPQWLCFIYGIEKFSTYIPENMVIVDDPIKTIVDSVLSVQTRALAAKVQADNARPYFQIPNSFESLVWNLRKFFRVNETQEQYEQRRTQEEAERQQAAQEAIRIVRNIQEAQREAEALEQARDDAEAQRLVAVQNEIDANEAFNDARNNGSDENIVMDLGAARTAATQALANMVAIKLATQVAAEQAAVRLSNAISVAVAAGIPYDTNLPPPPPGDNGNDGNPPPNAGGNGNPPPNSGSGGDPPPNAGNDGNPPPNTDPQTQEPEPMVS